MVQLLLMTAKKPMMPERAPLSIIMKAANETHPVQPVAAVAVRGVVEGVSTLMLDMMLL
jgi:hypothetical protein